jgi:hypothetical protein
MPVVGLLIPTSPGPYRWIVDAFRAGLAQAAVNHQAGLYVGRILKGVRPGDLPVVQTHKVRSGHQPEGRKGPRPRDPGDQAGAR